MAVAGQIFGQFHSDAAASPCNQIYPSIRKHRQGVRARGKGFIHGNPFGVSPYSNNLVLAALRFPEKNIGDCGQAELFLIRNLDELALQVRKL
ncbi:hypothetical protein D3C73_577120 [compost metagenome]